MVAPHIRNRTMRRGFADITLRKITGAVPDLAYLRMFGYPAYVHAPRQNRHNRARSARKGIFVGYSSDFPAWLVYMADTLTVIASRSVAFDETPHGPAVSTDDLMKLEVVREGTAAPEEADDGGTPKAKPPTISEETRDTS
eukprot:jgi/Tetstr1/448356/TSEL_035639.t1